ncbi:MAG: sigma-70 family RNA polymerase sigma factor [Verrucomicrobia bacterium]|nr:sigma-70 family RNA polymerase sigma factor [Verrucomicrobiota bacterium]
MTDSQTLLADYLRSGSDVAFRELVNRYIDLVYSTALRLVDGNRQQAEDVAQKVFVDLARTARSLSTEVKLGGWLHRHTCFVAAKTMRGERRRQSRERQAVAMNALHDNSEADFSRVGPILDEAINELADADRAAILLRFFEQQDFRSVGAAIGITEDAARMRVTRALEKLQEMLMNRGVTTTAGALSVALSSNVVQAAPAGLAIAISAAAAFAGASIVSSATASATKAIAMTTLQKAFFTTVLVVAAGTVLHQVRKSSALEAQLSTQQNQHASLTDALAQSGRDLEEALRELDALRLRTENDAAERVRMLGEVARLRRQIAEASADRSGPAAPPITPKPGAGPVEPVQVFVANADARVPMGQTLAVGGWTTAEGLRTIVLVKPTVVDESGNATTVDALGGRPGQIVLESQFFEIPDDVLDETLSALNLASISKLKTDGKATSSHSLFTSDEADLLLKTLKATSGVNLLSTPRILTPDGTQAALSVTENKVVAGREHALGPSLDVEPRITADGSSVNLTVVARLRKESSP